MTKRMAWLSGAMMAFAVAAGSDDAAPSVTTLRGEVVDLHCYITRGARGASHAGCANACIGRGVTPGFVAEDGRVFLLLAEKPFPVKEAVAGLAGETVKVTGSIVERDGMRGFQLKTAERVASSSNQ